jgi:hypothetical protein
MMIGVDRLCNYVFCEIVTFYQNLKNKWLYQTLFNLARVESEHGMTGMIESFYKLTLKKLKIFVPTFF